MTPELDLSSAAHAARQQARRRALRSARRAAWRASRGDPDAFRRIMLAWLTNRRAPTP